LKKGENLFIIDKNTQGALIMTYDFTSLMDRHNLDAIAVYLPGTPGFSITAPKEGFDVIPMWVADMNFPTVPTIPAAIVERTAHTAYGYFAPRQEYFDAISRWHEQRKGVAGVEPQHIGYANGVLAGVVAAANVLCS
jgi:cystathionine beta-lyase